MSKGLFSRLALWGLIVVCQIGPAFADFDDDLEQLMALLKVSETIEIMQQEGQRYGTDIAQEMLPDADLEAWAVTVADIYEAEQLEKLIREGFAEALAEADLAPILQYFETDEVREIVRIELLAREVFLDHEEEAAALLRFEDLRREGAPLVGLIHALIQDSDLIEVNVMGALNSNLMFYRGLADGGVLEMTQEEMVRDVWSQEEATREESREWLLAFLTFAYHPLEHAQLERYASFYRTPEGRVLNSAIFAAFDGMYEQTSYLLGLAVARHMASEAL